MALSDVISLGIGSPAGIRGFLLFGLSTADQPVMALSDVISLGIGSPAGIRGFLLFGLSTTDQPPTDGLIWDAPNVDAPNFIAAHWVGPTWKSIPED